LANGNDIPKNFSGGRGSAQNPYLISNGQELLELSRRILTDEMDGNRKYRYASYRQIADIDLGPISTWVPIGDVFYYPTGKRVDRPFAGVYDGGGYAVSNMTLRISEIQANKQFQRKRLQIGLFGVVNGDGIKNGIVKNIRLLNVTSVVDSSPSHKYGGNLGSITGTLINGTIENCKATEGKFRVTLNGKLPSNGLAVWQVGGIVGEIRDGIVQNCSNNTEMEVYSAKEGKGYTLYIGGISGSFSKGLLKNCSNSANVTFRGNGVRTIGGITASVQLDGEVQDCVNEGEIKYEGGTGCLIGGISGALDGIIRRCANKGTVTLSSTARGSEIGGIVGRIVFGGIIEESWNSGDINVNVNYNHKQTDVVQTGKVSYLPVWDPAIRFDIGGLVGKVYGGKVSDSYNRGHINGEIIASGEPLPSFIFIGGTVGLLTIDGHSFNIELANLYNVGLVKMATSGDTMFWQGGIIGGLSVSSTKRFNETAVTQCYWLGDANTLSAIGNYSGVRLTASLKNLQKEDFAKQESFKDWDFEKTWAINLSFPELINRP
jgi:hypothetical protein